MTGTGYLVRVVLFKCCDLLASDSMSIDNKSDPYVVFRLADMKQQSSPVSREGNPEWQPPEAFQFAMAEWEHEFLHVQVLDSDRVPPSDLIGSAIIPLALFAGNRHGDVYRYPLVLPDDLGSNGPTSDIYLQVSLTTMDGDPVEYYLY